MRKHLTGILCLLLAAVLCCGIAIDPAAAADEKFSVFVPEALEITVDASGAVHVPESAQIFNNAAEAVRVTDISVTMQNGWTAGAWDSGFAAMPADSRVLGLRLRGDAMRSDGTVSLTQENWVIDGSSSLDMDFEVRIPSQTAAREQETIAVLSLTLDWADAPGRDDSHTIYFNSGEHGSINDPSPIQTDPDGIVPPLPDITPDDGYQFDHWEDEAGNPIEPGDQLTGDATLHPVFTARSAPFTIRFAEGPNGTITDMTPIQTNRKGVVPSLPETIPDEDFLFDHWVDEDGNTVEMGTILTRDVTLTPIFTAIQYVPFTITAANSSLAGFDQSVSDWVIPATFNAEGTWYKVVGIGSNAFEKNGTLRTVAMPDTITSIGDWAFHGCSALTSVRLSKSISKMGLCAFASCYELTSVEIPEGVAVLGRQAFKLCHHLEAIDVPGTVRTIPYQAFSECTALTSATLRGVAEIGQDAFNLNPALSALYLPASLTSIADGAFFYCPSLHVYFAGSEAQWNALSIGIGSEWGANSTGDHYADNDNQWLIDAPKTFVYSF